MRRADDLFCYDHGLPWGHFCEDPTFHQDLLSIQLQQPPKYRRKRDQRPCWVWPHDRKQRPSRMSRLADLLRGRGPDMFFCSWGKRPTRQEWMDPSRCKDPQICQYLNRDGYKYNKHSRTYERNRGARPRQSTWPTPSTHRNSAYAPRYPKQHFELFANTYNIGGDYFVESGGLPQRSWH